MVQLEAQDSKVLLVNRVLREHQDWWVTLVTPDYKDYQDRPDLLDLQGLKVLLGARVVSDK